MSRYGYPQMSRLRVGNSTWSSKVGNINNTTITLFTDVPATVPIFGSVTIRDPIITVKNGELRKDGSIIVRAGSTIRGCVFSICVDLDLETDCVSERISDREWILRPIKGGQIPLNSPYGRFSLGQLRISQENYVKSLETLSVPVSIGRRKFHSLILGRYISS